MSEYTSGVNGRPYEPNTLHVTGDFDDFYGSWPFLCPFYGHEALEMGVGPTGLREVTLDLTFAGGRELYDLNGVKRQVASSYLFTRAGRHASERRRDDQRAAWRRRRFSRWRRRTASSSKSSARPSTIATSRRTI